MTEFGEGEPLAVHVSLAVAVFANDAPTRIAASVKAFHVPDIGRCQFEENRRTQLYGLVCKSPVRAPRQGWVSMGKQDGTLLWGVYNTNIRLPFSPLNLLPGMSPVFKWVTLGLDTRIREAIATGGQIEFRPERQIALLRREVDVREVRFLAAR